MYSFNKYILSVSFVPSAVLWAVDRIKRQNQFSRNLQSTEEDTNIGNYNKLG